VASGGLGTGFRSRLSVFMSPRVWDDYWSLLSLILFRARTFAWSSAQPERLVRMNRLVRSLPAYVRNTQFIHRVSTFATQIAVRY
jgi:hypothetical protein